MWDRPSLNQPHEMQDCDYRKDEGGNRRIHRSTSPYLRRKQIMGPLTQARARNASAIRAAPCTRRRTPKTKGTAIAAATGLARSNSEMIA